MCIVVSGYTIFRLVGTNDHLMVSLANKHALRIGRCFDPSWLQVDQVSYVTYLAV